MRKDRAIRIFNTNSYFLGRHFNMKRFDSLYRAFQVEKNANNLKIYKN